MKSVASKLGLSADASEEAVLAEVTKIMNRGEITPADLVILRNRSGELEVQVTSLLKEQVDGLLGEHGIKDEKVINRLKPLLTPMKNREERVACLTDLGFKAGTETPGTKGTPVTGRVLNRGEARTPATPAAGAAEGDEQATAVKIRNRANVLRRETPGKDWDSCWAEASGEILKQS